MAWLLILFLMLPQPSPAASTKRSHKKSGRAHTHRTHTVFLGSWHTVPYSPDPDAVAPTQTQLRVRALVVDGRIVDWTTGDSHLITETSYTVRQALRINNALPTAKHEHWIWQRGAWLSVDRLTGHVAILHLPGFDPRISHVAWFRNLAAYCGLRRVKTPQLAALVARMDVRKALVSAKLGPWNPSENPMLLTTPSCASVTWQMDPLRVTFQPTVGKPLTYSIVDDTPILMQPESTAASVIPIP